MEQCKNMKMELHVHTRFSKDSLLCFFPLYVKCLFCNIKCIAITEHNNIDGALKFQSFCKKCGNKVSVIIGEEIFSKDGEIIGLFLSENISKGMSAIDTIKEIRRQNGVVYVPHPFDLKRNESVLKEEIIEENRFLIDCIEIHNGRNIYEYYDEKQLEVANKYQIMKIIGSDAHTLFEIGRNYIEVQGDKIPQDRDEFMKSILTADMHKEKCIIWTHKLTMISKLLKMIVKGSYYEVYKSVIKKFKK